MFLRKAAAISVAICLMAGPAQADIFGDIANVVTAPLRAPTEATIRILQNDDPAQVVTSPLQAGGRIVERGSQELQNAQNVINQVPREAIRQTLGDDWVTAYNALTSSQRVQFELATTSGRYLGGCMQGRSCDINQLTAAPVAAALRDAYKVYAPYSVPLHPQLQRVLERVVPFQVLSAARIVVGAMPDLSVPGMLNAGYEVARGGHAVTIGNVIIFSRPLNFNDLNDWNWLLHELRHVEQYMSYSSDVFESIDGFAVNYIAHYNSVENDAQNAADQRQAMLNQMCKYGGC